MFTLIRLFKPILMVMSLTVFSVVFSKGLAVTVTHTMTPLNLSAQAQYLKGDPQKPAVLIIHGFLTTNQFHTVVSMGQALKDAGYSVLSPTLTLGINLRKHSVKCNSIHTHTLEEDVIEIQEWISWLEAQGHKNIVLVGHSSGSQELLAMLEDTPQPNVKMAIFTSLFYLSGEELGTLTEELDYAKAALAKNNPIPHKYSFLFCKNDYLATPTSFLSYHKLTRPYILEQLNALTIPHVTIMGQADRRYQNVGVEWLEELKKTGTHLVVVEGANHFFSSEHEFDLQDNIIQIINDFHTQ